MAIESDKRGPVKIELPEGGEADAASATTGPSAPTLASSGAAISLPSTPRKKPPRVRKPSPNDNRCVAPTGDLEAHRAALRVAFGNTLSDEFAEVMLGKLEIIAITPVLSGLHHRYARI